MLTKFRDYSVDKVILGKALGFLIKTLVKCIHTDKDGWMARLQMVIEVEGDKVTKKYATLTVSTNMILEANTTIIEHEELTEANSHIFKNMISKL